MAAISYIRKFEDIGMDDMPLVGGKNASLGAPLDSNGNFGRADELERELARPGG